MENLAHREELAAIKRKIRALADKTVENGATESEAMLAMMKVGELLLQYNLSMSEVTLRDEPCVTKSYTTDSKVRNVLWHIHGGLGSLCGVKVWYQADMCWNPDKMKQERRPIVWSFFGLESDVDMACYLAEFLSKAEKTSLAEFKATPFYKDYDGDHYSAVVNFCKGFGSRLSSRLSGLAAERRNAERKAADFHAQQMKAHMVEATQDAKVKAAEAKTGTALICVAKEKMIEAEFKKRGPKLRTVKSKAQGLYDFTARDAGGKAAANVNLNRPIAGGKPRAGLLK